MSNSDHNDVVDKQQHVLGSKIRITVAVSEDENRTAVENTVDEAFAECERLDNQYSRFKDNNLLADLNSKIGQWQQVNAELFFLLKEAEQMSLKTDWAFDLGVKAMLENWGYDKDYSFKTNELADDERNKNELRNKESFILGEDDKVKLFRPIEFGGLGKGYALDLIAAKLKAFKNVCVDAGGDLFAKGKPAVDTPWRIFFEHPKNTNEAIGEVNVDGFFLASSNSLKRRWAQYHHLVDPKTQSPAKDMLAVYTQASSGLLADAYSTALFVIGFNKAIKLLEDLGIEAMLVSSEGKIFRTDGFKGKLYLSV